MTESGNTGDIFEDKNFKKLASYETDLDEFDCLVNTHVGGYTQKKRLVDALKALTQKRDAIDEKLRIAKAVGKAKGGKLEEMEQMIFDNYAIDDLKEKTKSLNSVVQTMIDDCQLTALEKPIVLESLKERQAKAKAAEKTALFDKLELMIKAVIKKAPLAYTCANIEDIVLLNQSLKEVQRLEKKRILSEREREQVDQKAQIQADIEALEKSSRMWFETEWEFKPRFDQALADCEANWAKRLRLQEEAAFQKKIKEEQEELEMKRLKEIEKQELEAKEIAAKLEARRKEAMAKPQKAVPKRVVKEKKKGIKLDPNGLFLSPDEMRSRNAPAVEEEEEAEEEEEEEQAQAAEGEQNNPQLPEAPPPAPLEPEPAALDPAVTPSPPVQTKDPPKPPEVKAKPVIENKWASAVPDFQKQEQCSDEVNSPTMAEAAKVAEILVGPSLAEAVPLKKGAAPSAKKIPPAKKERKKVTKLAVSELGFQV